MFFFLLFFGVAGAVGFFVGREFLLTMGATAMKNSLREVAEIAKNTGTYAAECRKKGIVELDESSIKSIQLRFTSNTDYQIEVVCRQFSLDPIVVKEDKLPQFVTKVPGFGGVVWGQALSGVAVQSFGKTKSIFVEDEAIAFGTLDDVTGSLSPVTSCQGQGFTCCPLETTIGQGRSIQNVNDCSANCFESCVKRPIILSLSTQPFFDLKTREVVVNRGEQVTVAYVTDFAGSKKLDITINFGDGETQHMSEFSGDTVHQYNCTQTSCRYDLEVTAVNENGIEAARTAITRVVVIVQ